MKILSAAGFIILVLKWLGYMTQVSYWFPALLIMSPLLVTAAIFLIGGLIVLIGAAAHVITR